MHTETFPYFHSIPQEFEHLEDFACSFPPNDSMASTLSDYDFGVEGDLFKAPELVIEEPIIDLDPMTAAISMIACGGEVISPQDLKMPDTESSINFGQLLDEVFYECNKDILAKEETEQTLYEVLDTKIPVTETEGHTILENHLFSQGLFHKSVSSECLSSRGTIPGTSQALNFLDYQGMDFGTAYGMRRAFSEGDLKNLGYGNINHTSAVEQDQMFTGCSSGGRMEKLSRYRNKKAKRNFGRKIKYACRKALADSQPRIRGRFAKTEEMKGSKKQVYGDKYRADV